MIIRANPHEFAYEELEKITNLIKGTAESNELCGFSKYQFNIPAKGNCP